MKSRISISFYVLFLYVFACYAQEWPQIYDSASRTWTNMEQVQQAMAKSKAVFVGEKHDHQWGHCIELNLLEAYWETNGNVAIAMEMFERDVQHLLDGYLSGEIEEAFFLRHSRPWGNYQTDYRPLVEFAKSLRLPVLGMNVPRRYAAYIAEGKDQILFAMPKYEKNFMADELLALPGKYRDRFYEIMEGHASPEAIERYYRAQCLKDDTMAKSLLEFFKKNPNACVISYVGSFHSDERLGVVEKVLMKNPSIPVMTISIVPVEGTIEDPEQYSHLADFIFFAPGQKKATLPDADFSE